MSLPRCWKNSPKSELCHLEPGRSCTLVWETLLLTLSNVVDMAAYYSDYDRTNHVILATVDGNIHEIYYV
jgi:hypothetical protein